MRIKRSAIGRMRIRRRARAPCVCSPLDCQVSIREQRLLELDAMSKMIDAEKMKWRYISEKPEHQRDLLSDSRDIWEQAVRDMQSGEFLEKMVLLVPSNDVRASLV
jgi:hypothetical protein